jgi:hypothetical protein
MLEGIRAVFAHFADDTFYYLTVAKNSTLTFFTFDGISRTNGFHPLWQLILTSLFIPFGPVASNGQLYATFALSVALTIGGFVFAALALRRVTGSQWLPLWLIPGPFYLLFTSMDTIPHSYSPWAFMNGMETPLTVFLGGAFLLLLTRMSQDQTEAGGQFKKELRYGPLAALGLLMALITLTRLDDIFLVFGVVCSVILFMGSFRDRASAALILAGPTFAALGLYMLYNFATGQTLLPVSGLIKSTPTAAFSANMETFVSDLFPPLSHIVRPSKYVMSDWYATSYRTTAMFIPVIFALLVLVGIRRKWSMRRSLDTEDFLFLPMIFYIVLKCSYNILNVRFWNQGYWYYPLCVIMVNFMVLVIYNRWARSFAPERRSIVRGLAVISFIFIYFFHSAGVIYKASIYSQWPLEVWDRRDEINRELVARAPSAKLVDRSDGVFGYALSIPTMPLSGFTVDKRGYEARNRGRLLEDLFSRGYAVTWTGPHAWPLPEGFRLRKLFTHEPTEFTFMKLDPIIQRAGAAPEDMMDGAKPVHAVAGPDSPIPVKGRKEQRP